MTLLLNEEWLKKHLSFTVSHFLIALIMIFVHQQLFIYLPSYLRILNSSISCFIYHINRQVLRLETFSFFFFIFLCFLPTWKHVAKWIQRVWGHTRLGSSPILSITSKSMALFLVSHFIYKGNRSYICLFLSGR